MFYHFRALGVVNQCVPRTAPDGLKHLYDRNSPGNTANQNETKDKGGIEIDYELLLSNVENMLIADKARLFRREMKPKDLLVKSNPGLFGNMHPDITNPRDMYNFLSKRKFPKLADDESSFYRQKSVFEERLPRSNSFKDLNKSSKAKIQKKYHFHSHQDLSLIEKKDPSLAALNSNAPHVGPEEMTRLPEREKTMMTNFNLPALNDVGNETGKEEVNDGAVTSVSLPLIRSAPSDNVAKSKYSEDRVRKVKANSNRTRTNVTFNSKLDKWFSEMPSDVTDKADRAIMEDIIRERMATYQHDIRSNEKISKLKRHHTHLKSLSQIQHQYLELRAETTPKPNRSDLNLGHYKLKQKSSLNLKTEMTELGGDKETYKNTRPPIIQTGEGCLYKEMSKEFSKSKQEGLNGVKTINLDQFAVDAYKLNPNRRFTFAQLQNVQHNRILDEFNEDAMRRRADKEHWLRMSEAKTHPSIVNIGMVKERKENSRTSQLKQALSVVKVDTVKGGDQSNEHAPPDFNASGDNHSISSRSSGNNKPKKQYPSKLALSKFNTLEVFGGSKYGNGENDTTRYGNPLIKYDLRYARPSQVKGSKELDNSASGVISRPPQEMATVDFQFGAGEVIITRKATNGGSTNSGDGGLLNSPNAPPNNTEYSGLTPHTHTTGDNDEPNYPVQNIDPNYLSPKSETDKKAEVNDLQKPQLGVDKATSPL